MTDYKLWDDFVEKSPQGTIFSTTKWMGLFPCNYKIYGYFKNDSLLGGIIGRHCPLGFESGGFTLTPFQGILAQPIDSDKEATILSFHHEVATALSEYLKQNYKLTTIYNHYTFPDIRPFVWLGWKSQPVKYTQVIDLTDLDFVWQNLEKQTRYEITRDDRNGVKYGNCSDAVPVFDTLYGKTFERKDMQRPISSKLLYNLCEIFNANIYLGYDEAKAGVVTIEDSKRAYYILGASEGGGTSSLALWTAILDLGCMGIREIDLVGCNDQPIAQFKKGFGGRLMPYYGVSCV